MVWKETIHGTWWDVQMVMVRSRDRHLQRREDVPSTPLLVTWYMGVCPKRLRRVAGNVPAAEVIILFQEEDDMLEWTVWTY